MILRRAGTVVLAALLLAFGATAALAQGGVDIPENPAKFSVVTPEGEDGAWIFQAELVEGWHLYDHWDRDTDYQPTDITVDTEELPDGVETITARYPRGEEVELDFEDGSLFTYHGTVLFPLEVDGEFEELPVTIEYQACTDTFCTAPKSKSFSIEPGGEYDTVPAATWGAVSGYESQQLYPEPEDDESGRAAAGATADSSSSGSGANEADAADEPAGEGGDSTSGETNQTGAEGIIAQLGKNSLPLTLGLIFLLGLGLNLTPCVYPMIPLTISVFGGRDEEVEKGTVMKLAFFYVLGVVAVFSALGTFSALTGATFGSWLGNPWVVIALTVVVLLMALAMFGVFTMNAPQGLLQKAGDASKTPAGTFSMGALLGVVASPCVGPVVIGLLAWVSAQQSAMLSFSSFFMLGVGLALPYFFLALYSNRLHSLPNAGEWMVLVKEFFGFVLLGMALWFLTFLPQVSQGLLPVGLSIIAFAAAVWFLPDVFGIFGEDGDADLEDESEPSGGGGGGGKGTGYQIMRWALTAVLVLAGIFTPRVFSQAASADGIQFESIDATRMLNEGHRQTTMIDVRADWCVACKELELATFSKPDVAEVLREHDIRAVKADVTTPATGDLKKLIEKYGVQGAPTVMFIGPDGEEVPDSRLVGFLGPEEFKEHVRQAMQNVSSR